MIYSDFTIQGDFIALHETVGDAPQQVIRISSIDWCAVNKHFEYMRRGSAYVGTVKFTEAQQGSDWWDNYQNVNLAWALLDAILGDAS